MNLQYKQYRILTDIAAIVVVNQLFRLVVYVVFVLRFLPLDALSRAATASDAGGLGVQRQYPRGSSSKSNCS